MHDPVGGPPPLWQLFTEGPFQRSVKKPLFGKPYLEVSAHMLLGTQVYERGAILGRARPDSLALLLQMCSTTEDTSELENLAREMVEARLGNFEGTPADFLDFYLTGEAAEGAGQALPSGAGFLFLQAHAKRKVPVEISATRLAMSCTEGLAFGAVYPDATERMLHHWSGPDREQWSRAHQAGLDIPAEPPTASVAQLEQEVLSVVAPFAAHFYAHLVEPLRLAP